jgi:predicted NACHT family NTPase
MPSLPSDFLTEMAHKYALSPEQEAAFVALYSRSDDDEVEAAESLHVTASTFRSRMTGVYDKFSIGGKGSGKFYKLQIFLMQQYQNSGAPPMPVVEQNLDINALVQQARSQLRPILQERCGTMRVLDMTQPIALTGEQGIYTNVNILEKLTGHRRLELAELLELADLEEFDRFGLSYISEERVPGLNVAQRYPKLMVLGKPGAGKTTFLKYLAMQCMAGRFLPDRLPLFVTLKNFAEAEKQPSLLKYLGGERSTPILKAGKALILLDGLDEVREEDTKRVIRQIEQFSEQFSSNHFVITCRIAAKEYTFGQFTEVEVADFNEAQIDTFARNWFRVKGDPDRATLFRKKLDDNKPIAELATNPLLLTLLCLMFEDVTDFPANRSELYKEGLDVLLKKWDGKRKIERDSVYKNLSLKRKEDLLSQIALTTFEQKEYFFKQRSLENYIGDFIRNLPDAKTDPEALHLDSEAVLKSIEAHHGLLVERAKGIYSFSHLTFQEYFAAREIAAIGSQKILQRLVQNITEKRWREVFLLTAGMMRNADELVLLIKEQVDQLLAGNEKLQQFLIWVQQKSSAVEVFYKPAAIRAFYFYLARDLAFIRARDLDLDLACDRARARDLARDRDRALDLAFTLTLDRARNRDLDRDFAFTHNLNRALDRALDPQLQRRLQELRNQLPDASQENRETFKQWWRSNGETWTEELRSLMTEHRNIGHDWQFTEAQNQLLQQYHDANKLLVDCLNSDCYVSRTVREAIEDTLLLPIAVSGSG